jgi:hypothetical protein
LSKRRQKLRWRSRRVLEKSGWLGKAGDVPSPWLLSDISIWKSVLVEVLTPWKLANVQIALPHQ